MSSLFGYLVTRFSTQPENLATESLNYLIHQSDIAKRAFLRYISQTQVKLPDDLVFMTQAAGEDEAVPDMIGKDSDGRQILLVESKFWAGLTDNQPVTYLNRLPEQTGGVLLFIAPALRFETLWSELLRRCGQNNNVESQEINSDLKVKRLDHNRVLAMASWRSVLSSIHQEVSAAGEHALASDVMQLQGLCDQMDGKAFVPFDSRELVSMNGTRIQQYCQLVDDITQLLKREELASTKGLSQGGRRGYYGQYMTFCSWSGLLQFEPELWGKYRETPLWLKLKGADWKFSHELKERLSTLAAETPSCLFQHEEWLAIPLYLPTGAEWDLVLEAIMTQLREIAACLKD